MDAFRSVPGWKTAVCSCLRKRVIWEHAAAWRWLFKVLFGFVDLVGCVAGLVAMVVWLGLFGWFGYNGNNIQNEVEQ